MATDTPLTLIGKQNGFELYRSPANECFLWNGDEYELTNCTLDAGSAIVAATGTASQDDFLTQIGKMLGFGKVDAKTAGGITAATGGALVLLAVIFLISRK